MTLRRRRVLLSGVALWTVGTTAVLVACEDDGRSRGLSFEFDASAHPPNIPAPDAQGAGDASPHDASPHDASTDVGADAFEPASPLDAFRGIWHGTGMQAGASWTILVDIHGGQPGQIVGMITYPSIDCGGTLELGVSDAGVGDAGDAGASTITLHESVSASCITEGEDTFTLLPDGGLAYEYRVTPEGPVGAWGTLTRLGERGVVSSTFGGVWHAGAPNENNLRTLMLSVSRDDAVGAPSGVFLLDRDGSSGCAGYWTLASTSPGTLRFTEVFEHGQTGCDGPGTTLLEKVAADVAFSRTIDGGVAFDAGADGGGLKLTRF